MEVKKTKINGVFLIKPQIFKDKRGYFFESFNSKEFRKAIGLDVQFIQDNQSLSSKNVLRGLHFQHPPFAQAKLVSVIKGEVLDVVVDIRKGSDTYGEYIAEHLSEENHQQLYIPEGMAHGFLTLKDDTIFTYKCSNHYNKDSEDGIIWNDSNLNINWNIKKPLVSEKDQLVQNFSSFVSPF
ncbi:MAG: dTDP-4-dehydrorhamnose 3,5-epimerase [Crocinitomicaceae bacterium]|nr:MAG: dTDP-4-dehydrorhamnose 3,5-epimerase [Crocinitomicaceae bacterium]